MGEELTRSKREHHVIGYPSLAALIASDPDKTTAIFPRFDRLAARNILYIVSELAELQTEQDQLDEEDFYDRGMEAKKCARSWTDFKDQAATDEKQKRRMELAMRIRTSMQQYREAVMFEAQLAAFPTPSKRTLHAFLKKYYNDSPDRTFPTLGGSSSGIFDNIEGLAALKVDDERDRLTIFVQNHLGFLFTGESDGVVGYSSDRGVAVFVTCLSTIFAATLLIGAIMILYVVTSPKWRLGLIGAFTVVFAASVGLMTNSRRAEVFGATAAYAAVLVVFVSGNLGG